jgi:riboflavin-specific deaminase-like protein
MIALFPRPTDDPIDPMTAVAAERRQRPDRAGGRPWVMTNMIASADGATATDGVSGALGGPADLAMFKAIRGAADAILVGASTVRQEQYRPPTGGSPEQRAERRAQGRPARPLIVIITASLSLDPDLPLFADPDDYRPLIITVETAPADQRAALAPVAEVVTAGQDQVDLRLALDLMAARGLDTVLSEGGPSLNGQLIAEDLIDEWNLTISPILAGGTSKRPATGQELLPPGLAMALDRVWHQDDLLFCRWIRRTHA